MSGTMLVGTLAIDMGGTFTDAATGAAWVAKTPLDRSQQCRWLLSAAR
jgi:hypothetical protein